MELIKAVKKIPARTNIKIGSRDGSSFWYVGNRKDFLNQIETYKQKALAYSRDCVPEARKTLIKLAQNAPTWSDFILNEIHLAEKDGRNPKRLRYSDYLAEIKEYEKRLLRAESKVESAEEYMIEYVEIDKREVVETGMSISEDAQIIIVEGNEAGVFWTVDESEKPAMMFNRKEA